MFGPPGSAACAAAATYYRLVLLDPRAWCYLSGPTATSQQAAASPPPAVSPRHARTFVVQRGTVILEAEAANAHPPSLNDPRAQFYVLRDRVALFGDEITNPEPSTNQAGQPDVVFEFTGRGAAAFHRLTAQLAHRGELERSFGQVLNQHFAVALDDQLLTARRSTSGPIPTGFQPRQRT